MKSIYWAAALFTTAERGFNLRMVEAIQNRVGDDIKIRLPQDEIPGQDIFDQNMLDLQRCDLVIAVVDGPDVDSGTAFEIGYAKAIGKKIWLLRTDFRVGGDDNVHPVNLMLGRSADKCFWFDSREHDTADMARQIAGELNRG